MPVPEQGRRRPVLALAGWGAMLALIAGCASEPVKTPSVSARDPSRGMVTLTYEYAPDEPRKPNWKRARKKALRYCREQGYDEAELSGEPDRECKADNPYRRCTRYFLSRTWRCRNVE